MRFLTYQVMGLLLGLAAGDRNRGPAVMALHLAESLLERNGYDADDIGARYLQWWREGAYDTGPTAAGVLSLVNAGQTWEQAARNADHALGGPAGCNPAHRCAPLAICHQIMDSELSEVAFREACLTHLHPLSGDVAAAMSCLCRELVKGVSWPNAFAFAARTAWKLLSGPCGLVRLRNFPGADLLLKYFMRRFTSWTRPQPCLWP